MPTDRGISASGIAENIGSIKDFLRRHGHCRNNHRELICGHHSLLLCTRAPVHRASNIAHVLFRIPWFDVLPALKGEDSLRWRTTSGTENILCGIDIAVMYDTAGIAAPFSYP